jgi:hypothetical protein
LDNNNYKKRTEKPREGTLFTGIQRGQMFTKMELDANCKYLKLKKSLPYTGVEIVRKMMKNNLM